VIKGPPVPELVNHLLRRN